MHSTTEMGERHGRVLAKLAELGLALARGLQARAQAADSDEQAQGLALAFHRVARSVRLSLALESRLARERLQTGREQQVAAERAAEARKAQVRAAVGRAVLAEVEADEADSLLDELDERLDEAALYDQFTDGPVEAQIARIRAELGLPANQANDAAANDPGAAPVASAAGGVLALAGPGGAGGP